MDGRPYGKERIRTTQEASGCHSQEPNSGKPPLPLSPIAQFPNSINRVVGIDGRIIKKDGVQGELHIKPPHPMKGYLNNASGTSEAFSADGWVRSGDVGYVKHGKWYVIDRTKDLIKVRGWQVSPAEIEAVLVGHPGIADAAVIGIAADDGTGEVPQGFIVRAEGSKVDEDEVKSFLRERLARYKEVDHVVFVDRIPRNPTGKILRRVLRAEREPVVPTPDQEAAAEYSQALRNLEKQQMVRKSMSRSSSDGGSSAAHSRAASLTDASTIDSPFLSPAVEKSELDFEVKKRDLKRKGSVIEMFQPKPKRRSARLSAIVR